MTHLWIVLLIAGLPMCSSSGGWEHASAGYVAATARSRLPTTASAGVTGTTAMTPVLKAHYTLNVTSRSMAALDSSVRFDAELTSNLTYPEMLAAPSDRFIYQWMNTATKNLSRTVDGLSSSLLVTFGNVATGDYLMTVAVYLKDDPTTILAFETKKFTMTRELNGLLVLEQRLDYQRHASIFSTRKPVKLTAVVHDQFLQTNLDYAYFWYNNSHILDNTKQATYTTTFVQPFNSSLTSVIMVYTKDSHALFPSNNGNGGLPFSVNGAPLAGSSDGPPSASPSAFGQQYKAGESQFVLRGKFLESVEFKDPIDECVVTRVDASQQDRAISLKKEATVNISCAGSIPSSVCVSIADLNTSIPTSSDCTPTLFVDRLDHIITIRLTSTGWSNVHFFVYNDISRYQIVESFYGYDPDSVNIPALSIPIVFGVIGVLIILVGGVYFVRLRKKPLVEVADFDFHPLLTHSRSQGRFSRVASKVMSVLPQGHTEAGSSRQGRLTSEADSSRQGRLTSETDSSRQGRLTSETYGHYAETDSSRQGNMFAARGHYAETDSSRQGNTFATHGNNASTSEHKSTTRTNKSTNVHKPATRTHKPTTRRTKRDGPPSRGLYETL